MIPDSLCVHTWSLTLTTVRSCCVREGEGRGGEGRGGGDKCECVKVHPCIRVCNEGDSSWINVIAHTPYSSHGLLWGRGRGGGEGGENQRVIRV